MSSQAIRPSFENLSTADRAIIEELASFRDIPALLLDAVMELGREMGALTVTEKKMAKEVAGCHTQVWILARKDATRIFFRADSDALMTKGLAALFVRLFSGATPEEIKGYDPIFPVCLQLEILLGSQRNHGLQAIVNTFRWLAEAHSSE